MGMNMQQLMKQAQKMQREMQKAQEELAAAQVEGVSGGGMVKVTATGAQEIVAISIDPEIVDPEDVEMLEDLVMAAVKEALANAQALASEKMGRATGPAWGCFNGLSISGGTKPPGARTGYFARRGAEGRPAVGLSSIEPGTERSGCFSPVYCRGARQCPPLSALRELYRSSALSYLLRSQSGSELTLRGGERGGSDQYGAFRRVSGALPCAGRRHLSYGWDWTGTVGIALFSPEAPDRTCTGTDYGHQPNGGRGGHRRIFSQKAAPAGPSDYSTGSWHAGRRVVSLCRRSDTRSGYERPPGSVIPGPYCIF